MPKVVGSNSNFNENGLSFSSLYRLSRINTKLAFSIVSRTMEEQEQGTRSRVLKVDSKESWDFHVNQATIQGYPIVAHFTAIWCIPSVAMNPFMEELASMYQNMSFLTIDVDEVKDVASKYEVKAMPTFLLLKAGVPVDKIVGANPDEIKKRIQSLAQSNLTDIP